MNIGPTDASRYAELTTDFAEHIRSAHREAEEATSAVATDKMEASAPLVESSDPVGSELRAELDRIVAAVISAEHTDSADLVDVVVEAVVDDRLQRSNLPADEETRDFLCRQLRTDPVVLSELDDLLQELARQQALQRR